MQPIETVLGLVAACVGLGMIARRVRVPYPIFLVVGGLLLGLQPWVPRLPPLDPNVVFILFLPPLLYAGAFNTHWKAFRKQLRAITLLAVGLVLFTTVAVAAVAHHLIGLPWAVGFVLGAIVSPPDAVAAMAITQRVRVPKIVATLLEGESLVNDAAALVAYRVAVAAVATGVFHLDESCVEFVKVAVGGVALGIAVGVLAIRVHNWVDRRDLADAKLTITMTLLTPYAAYLPAEHLHLSGVLAVVAAGLWVGHRAGRVFYRELRDEARAVWEWIDFLLNSLVFILIGFQYPVILEQLNTLYHPAELVGYAAAVSGTMILARMLWVFPGAYVPRWIDRRVLGTGEPYPPWQYVAVVAWTGMRGVVSLAAALAVPTHVESGDPFPYRDLLLFLTFWAIFATLVGQGLTLPLVIRLLGVDRRAAAESPDHHLKVSC